MPWADTLKVRDKYNKAWLKAEYNYAVRTADAVARWAEIEKDKEHIDLLYETVGDSRVRPDHATLEGVCLPVDDPFWSVAYPPNGWNCPCRVLRVAKGSHPYSDSSEATEAFLEATTGKGELFRYNPAQEQCIFSDKHPYYSKRGIRHCAIDSDKLAANLDKNEECEVLRNLTTARQSISLTEEQKAYRKELQREAIEKYKGMKVVNEVEVAITTKGIKEFINQPHEQYFEKNELVRNLPDLIQKAKYRGITPYHKENSQIVCNHIFEVEIDKKISYLIAREEAGGNINLYSISDSDTVLVGLNRKDS